MFSSLVLLMCVPDPPGRGVHGTLRSCPSCHRATLRQPCDQEGLVPWSIPRRLVDSLPCDGDISPGLRRGGKGPGVLNAAFLDRAQTDCGPATLSRVALLTP